MMPATDDVGVVPVCADPGWLPVVDAAFERPGGPEAARLLAEACPRCPVWRECLQEALAGPEHGVWGGTSPKVRTTATGRSAAHSTNLDRRCHKLPPPDQVRAQRAQGASVADLAERYGCSTSAVYQRLRSAA